MTLLPIFAVTGLFAFLGMSIKTGLVPDEDTGTVAGQLLVNLLNTL